MSEVKNLFIESEEAKRYNIFRPVYHHLLAHKLQNYFQAKINRILDVACGTGHSTNHLSKICNQIVGCDLSEAMLIEARKNSQIEFIKAKAEDLPFADAYFDYLNISMAYQWLNQPRFLMEAKRVLSPNGLLGIDNYGFSGQMIGNDRFLNIYKDFDNKFMRPAKRNKNYPDDHDVESAKIQFVQELKYDHEVNMSKHQFINYLMTRSNFLELSTEKRAEVAAKLTEYYEDSFGNTGRRLYFYGAVKLYRMI